MKMISKLAIGAVAATLALGVVAADAKTLKLQASSKAGDWAHRFMTDNWGPKLGMMTNGAVKVDVLPTKAVVPHRETIDAVAGIGNPNRFFASLEALGCTVHAHPFSDHHQFTEADLAPFGTRLLVMTAKDAVKCRKLRLPESTRVLRVRSEFEPAVAAALDALLQRVVRTGRDTLAAPNR